MHSGGIDSPIWPTKRKRGGNGGPLTTESWGDRGSCSAIADLVGRVKRSFIWGDHPSSQTKAEPNMHRSSWVPLLSCPQKLLTTDKIATPNLLFYLSFHANIKAKIYRIYPPINWINPISNIPMKTGKLPIFKSLH